MPEPTKTLTVATLESVSRPKQQRSEQTLLRILDAAESLIAEKGLAETSVPEIVRRAESSVGGFYARFRDKNEMLRALEERFFQELRLRVANVTDPERWSDASIAQIVRSCVQELVDTFRTRQHLIRAFLYRASQEPEFVEDGRRLRRGVSQRLAALLLPRADEFEHPDPQVAVELGVQLAFGLMHQLVVFGEIRVGERTLTDSDLVEELTRTFLCYAGVAPDSSDAPPQPGPRGSP